MYLTLDHIEPLSDDVWTFWFQPDKPIRFDAGQYFDLTVPHANMDNRGDRRTMTLSSAPHEPLAGVTMRFTLDGSGSTYKQACRQLRPGDQLFGTAPMGDFVLPKDPTIPLVFVAAGVGITPIRSMVAHLNATQQQRTINLVYAVKTQDDLLFTDILSVGYVTFMPLLSHPDDSWPGHKGRLSGEQVIGMTGDPHNKLFFLSGPEPLIMELYGQLQRLGVPRSSVVLDYFPGYRI